MKTHYLLILVSILFSCSNTKKERQVVKKELQAILDTAQVSGAILIYDAQKKTYYANDFNWAMQGKLPASTFKIPNSIIALETGIVKNDSTMFKWDGKKRYLKIWEQDLIFKKAFQYSCVPCYQEVALKIGVKRMNTYLDKLNFGKMQVDTTNITSFWLEGDSKINQFQQINFLRRFYNSKLPIAKRTERIVKRMMLIEHNENYILSGKTGWSIRNGNNNGWFVGYVKVGEKHYFFATNVIPKAQFNMKMFSIIRKEITYKALKQLDIIE